MAHAPPRNLYRQLRHWLWRLLNKPFPASPHHITRFSMYARLRAVGPLLPNRIGPRILSISHSENLGDILGLQPSEVVPANYPEVSILRLPFPDASFDYVLSDQVLEHVEGNPFEAVKECLRVLRPGGIAVHTTTFEQPIHSDDNTSDPFTSDFWRFTPSALRLLHKGCEILECGGWGNPTVWEVAKDGMRWRGVPTPTWHPMHRIAVANDPYRPILTWVIARKPG